VLCIAGLLSPSHAERVAGPAAAAPVNGRVQLRWPSGRLRSDATYRDGAYDGDVLTWYESGQPYQRRHFLRGHEEGTQQAWTDRGALYVNYEVRDGRRYGLLNATPCVEADAPRTTLPYYDAPDFTPRWAPATHRVGAFGLMTQTSTPISERSLDHKIHVASFLYTKCAAVCPVLVAQLARVQSAIRTIPNAVIVSYSVTPDVDTPAALTAFGRDHDIDPAHWWLVTGSHRQIYALARGSYFADDDRVGPQAGGSSDAFLHTEKILLVDGERRLRGVYNGTQPHEIDLLIEDIRRLAGDDDSR
jgi:protein SCO1/2